jgi:hypothetical protein
MEVDQRNVGLGIGVPAGTFSGMAIDRWNISKAAATATFTARQVAPPTALVAPGTSYQLSAQCLRVLLSAQQATLAAGEYLQLVQNIEGPLLRELIGDVHSLSLLVQCTSAPFTFTVRLTSGSPYYTLTKLCTISTANQWTLISLPNLPVWTPSATWPLAAGGVGYTLGIGLGAGSTFTSPANDTWQSGNFVAGPGTGNFAAFPVNTSFYVGLVQHEPGALCSTPMDKPFTGSGGNYEECLRYYQKTYLYGVAPATVSSPGMRAFFVPAATTNCWGSESFKKPMAKVPTMTAYNNATGAANSVQDVNGINHASASIGQIGDSGFCFMSFTTATTTQMHMYFHYTADTGQ